MGVQKNRAPLQGSPCKKKSKFPTLLLILSDSLYSNSLIAKHFIVLLSLLKKNRIEKSRFLKQLFSRAYREFKVLSFTIDNTTF